MILRRLAVLFIVIPAITLGNASALAAISGVGNLPANPPHTERMRTARLGGRHESFYVRRKLCTRTTGDLDVNFYGNVLRQKWQ